MPNRRPWVIAALALVTLSASLGDTADAGRRYRSRKERAEAWLLEGGVGFRIGSSLVHGIDVGTIKPAHLELGLRNGRLLLAAEYQFATVQLPDDAIEQEPIAGATTVRNIGIGVGRGLMHQVTPLARYSFGRVGESDAGSDLFIEAGLGLQQYRWDAGGVLTRLALSFGLGGSFWGLGRERHGGLAMGVRVTLSPRKDNLHAPPACGGPCDHATTPTSLDRTILFDVTLMFGK
ncbi:MAG: hypothetical protein KIT31_30240 [Deltaproteobacteria bacterium]|nr:hypothetical protein [Deltaproteobacteria bacterium]